MNDKLKPVGNNASNWTDKAYNSVISDIFDGIEPNRMKEIALTLNPSNAIKVTTKEVWQMAAICSDYFNQAEKLSETEAALKELQQVMSNIRSLCGYVEDGSDTVLKIFQDDACREWFAKSDEGEGFGSSIFEAINDAAANIKDLGY